MALYNIINRSSIKEGNNILAEHYQQERLQTEELLKGISSSRIGHHFYESTLTVKPKSLGSDWRVFDLPDTLSQFLTGGKNPQEELVTSNKKVALPDSFIISRLRHYLKEMAIIPPMAEKIALSTEYLVFFAKSGVSPHVLLPFALSKYMQCILDWAQTGNAHPRFSSKTLRNTYLPDILIENSYHFQSIIEKAIKLLEKSKSLYTQATQLLDDALGLNQIEFEKEKSYTVKFSEIVRGHRMDAEHFTPSYDQLVKLLSDKEQLSQFSHLLKYNKRGKQPTYAEAGLPVLNSKHIRVNQINFVSLRVAIPPDLPQLIINKGDVLINGTGVGTIGRAAPFLEDLSALPDNHVTILRAPDLDPGYLSVYLNSQAGQIQVEKYLRGSSGQIELYPNDIAKFLIWEAPKELQSEIGDMIREAYQKEKESKQLLEQAKQEVETLIEQAAQTT